MRLTVDRRAQASRIARQAALLCVLGLPVALLYARALAEILIGVTDVLFLLHLWVTRSWRATGRGRAFALAALSWWVWQIVCSTFGTGGLALSLVLFRLPLFALALGNWVLAGPRARRALWWAVAGAVTWIVIECWQQDLTGRNIFGAPRWEDGALTGPLFRPRAGPELILTLFPILLPAVSKLLASPARLARVAGVLTVALGAATVLLIGQRMPSALLILGLVLSGLLLPRLLLPTVLAGLTGGAVLAASPFVAPATYAKLIVHTREQLGDFANSAYGQIWLHALAIARQHPWMGQGFDAFRRACAGPSHAADPACNIHPHNYYLEAADNGGVPLLLLFTAMAGTACAALARGPRDALRTGLLVGFVLALWPLASTSSFTAMPNAGWIFLLLGLGLSAHEA